MLVESLIDASRRKAIADRKRGKRFVQAVIYTLLIGIIVGLIGWINQGDIASRWRWFTVTRPYAMAQIWPYVLSAAREQALKPGDSFKECKQDCPEMVVVPAGTFMMGALATGSTSKGYASETPLHAVKFALPFAVSKHEVTFADWDACVAGGGCEGARPTDQGWGRGPQPVINVSWIDAMEYVTWLSQLTGKPYRLLSEAEYEYAARAGTTTVYPWGDDLHLNGKAMANCDGCGSPWDDKQAAPVGSFPPNNFRLYDMVGNVFAWTADCWHANYLNAPADGSVWLADGDCTMRPVRGGSWNASPDMIRSSARASLTAATRINYVGFRIARTLIAP